MKRNTNQAITLIELLISILLLTMVVMALFGIDIFSRNHLVSSDRRAKLQNEASYVIEHITKHFINAIGDSTNPPVVPTQSGSNTASLQGTIDGGDGIMGTADDYTVSYCYETNCKGVSVPYALYFLNNTDPPEPLAKHVSAFRVTYDPAVSRNYMNVTVSTCWDPSRPCTTPNNPTITLNTTINFPSVSIN